MNHGVFKIILEIQEKILDSYKNCLILSKEEGLNEKMKEYTFSVTIPELAEYNAPPGFYRIAINNLKHYISTGKF